jgi:VWFA-related protein
MNFIFIQSRSNNKFMRFILVICLVMVTLTKYSLSGLLVQQSKNSDNPDTLQHEVTVTLKLIQVYVTDKKGNPITDLNQAEFELYDNGKRVNLTEFEKHILYSPTKTDQEEKPDVSSAGHSQMNRKFFLFFDFAFNNARGIIKSKEAALYFISTKLHPSDEVAILSYSTMKGLTLHEFLTTDHHKVREVIEGFGLKDVLGGAENLNHEGEYSVFRGLSKEIYKDQILNFSKIIKDLAKAFGYIPGYKHIILFSSGAINNVVYGRGNSQLNYKWEDMAKALASADCLVYSLDSGSFESSIDQETGIFYRDISLRGGSTLERLAEVTGGKYYGNIGDYQNITEEIQDLSCAYYVLGYYIDEKWDGKYHKIKVEVKRKDCKVHAQQGYFNPKPFTKYTELEKRMHLVDLALNDTPLSLIETDLPLLVLPYSVIGGSQLAVISKIQVERLKEISGKKLEVNNLIFDTKNFIVSSKREEVDFSRYSQKNIYYCSLFTLPPGQYKYCVVLRNSETGKGERAASSVVIPERIEYGFRIDPPLLLKPEKNSVYLFSRISEKSYSEEDSPSLLDIYPFDSTEYSPLIEEIEQGKIKLLAVVRSSIAAEVNFSGHIVHLSSGKEIPVTLSILNTYHKKYSFTYLIETSSCDLIPGEYCLYLLAEEMTSKSRSHTKINFAVR